MSKLDIKAIDFHRNGVSGVGFYSVLFSMVDEYGKHRPNMHASLFLGAKGYCAVHDLDDMTRTWRGDWFQEELMRQLEQLVGVDDDHGATDYDVGSIN